MEKSYYPEQYWSEVAKRIKSRTGKNVIAGDDEPFYRYKRKQFLKMLSTIDFEHKKVLEIGSGPGGNLEYVHQFNPQKLVGVDTSSEMVALASQNLATKNIKIHKINGTSLPFESNTFDIVFTATVLQHNTDEAMLKQLFAEIARVSAKHIFLFEKVDASIKGDELCLARPVNYYATLAKNHGFELVETQFINIYVSYLFSGVIRKFLNSKNRKEGEPLSSFSILLQNILLPFTQFLDPMFKVKKDVAKLAFVKKV